MIARCANSRLRWRCGHQGRAKRAGSADPRPLRFCPAGADAWHVLRMPDSALAGRQGHRSLGQREQCHWKQHLVRRRRHGLHAWGLLASRVGASGLPARPSWIAGSSSGVRLRLWQLQPGILRLVHEILGIGAAPGLLGGGIPTVASGMGRSSRRRVRNWSMRKRGPNRAGPLAPARTESLAIGRFRLHRTAVGRARR